ncbi:MAG: efflux RND transporter permease subunit, partial [Chloroflexi bacterium]|nr:efflux RND transporter permease subunit [Chloroflexota bacterium]
VMRAVEGIIRKEPGVQNWSRLTGALSGSGLEITPQNQGDLLVELKNGRRPSSDDIQSSLREKILTAAPNLQIDFAQILGDLIGDLSGSPSPIEVKIFGPDMGELRALSREVGARITKITGVVDESGGIVDSGPETEVRIDPVRAAQAGIANDTLTAATQAVLDGQVVGSVLKGEVLEPIRVKYPGPSDPEMDRTMLAATPILSPSGQAVPLSAVAEVSVQPGSPDLNRENQRLMVSVTARLEKLDLGTAIREVKKSLANLALPPGYSIEYGGLYKSQQQSFQSLTVTLLLAILFVVSVLIVAFRSFRVVASLLAAAILSLSGVLVALYLTSTPLNISSFTGAIMIVGIVTENGVLLFDELQRLQRVGTSLSVEALLTLAVKARLRPILMTTFAAILTLLPLSFGIGAGAAMQKPLAVAVIGGLTLSMFFTLVLAPVIYASLSSMRGRVRTRKYAALRQQRRRRAHGVRHGE